MQKLNPSIIRIGDKVKIIKSEFFVRCGYDNDHQSACEYITKEYKDKIANFIKDIKWESNRSLQEILEFGEDFSKSNLFKKIVSAMAYERVGNLRRSGMERKIYIESEKWLKGKTFTVSDIFFCKTGIYYRPNGGYDSWSGEYYYDPGGLNEEKTHKILVLSMVPRMKALNEIDAIEAANVKKVF